MDKRGGKRPGAGRKGKAEEQSLVEKLKPLEPQALKVLGAAVRSGEQWAIKLYMEYLYGKPKQTIDNNLKFQEQPLFMDISKPVDLIDAPDTVDLIDAPDTVDLIDAPDTVDLIDAPDTVDLIDAPERIQAERILYSNKDKDNIIKPDKWKPFTAIV